MIGPERAIRMAGRLHTVGLILVSLSAGIMAAASLQLKQNAAAAFDEGFTAGRRFDEASAEPAPAEASGEQTA